MGGHISDICDKLSNLRKREKEIDDRIGTDVDIVEKDVLCRRIRFKKRDLSRQLSLKTVEKALLKNVEEEAANEDDEGSEDDVEDIIAAPGAIDALELPDNR